MERAMAIRSEEDLRCAPYAPYGFEYAATFEELLQGN